MKRRLYLGVDGGNSKTIAVVSQDDGVVRGTGMSGNGDIYGAASVDAAVKAVLDAVEMALKAADATVADVVGAAFRLAGVDWREDQEFWEARLAESSPGLGRVSIANDGFGSIRSVEPSGVGVAIVAGTGPAVAGRGPSGEEWSVSFWIQEALGASGIGVEGLRAVFRSAIGLGPSTALTDVMLTVFGLDDVESLLHLITGRGRPQLPRATLAPLVTEAAAGGDPVSRAIVVAQAAGLAEYARVVAERVGFDPDVDPVPVALAGAVLVGPPAVVADAVVEQLADRMPKARVEVASLPPVAGAVLDALAESGCEITPQLVDNLRDSGHSFTAAVSMPVMR